MAELWTAFLSCDARDMCRVGPALMRNHLAWLAFVVRLITLLPLVLPGLWIPRVTSDVYWANRQEHPVYLAYKVIRDEADQSYDAWTSGDLSDDDARITARVLADRLRRWDEPSYLPSLFTRDVLRVDKPECPPFCSYDGRLCLLLGQERKVGDDLCFCDYLIFVF
jgi:hypothetical protein